MISLWFPGLYIYILQISRNWVFPAVKSEVSGTFNTIHPTPGLHILYSVLYAFSKVLTRRICLTIMSFFRQWSFSLFLCDPSVWFRSDVLEKKKLHCTNHSYWFKAFKRLKFCRDNHLVLMLNICFFLREMMLNILFCHAKKNEALSYKQVQCSGF